MLNNTVQFLLNMGPWSMRRMESYTLYLLHDAVDSYYWDKNGKFHRSVGIPFFWTGS